MSGRFAICCDIPRCPALVLASTPVRAQDQATEAGWVRPGGPVGPDHCPLHAAARSDAREGSADR